MQFGLSRVNGSLFERKGTTGTQGDGSVVLRSNTTEPSPTPNRLPRIWIKAVKNLLIYQLCHDIIGRVEMIREDSKF